MSDQEPSGLTNLSTVVGMSAKAWAVAKGALPSACRWMVGVDAVFDLKLRQDVAAAYVDHLRQVLKEQSDTREQIRASPRNLTAHRHLQWLGEEEQSVIKRIAAIQYAKDLAGDAVPEREIEQHWVDTFEVHARRRTEPWRSQLLSRALAFEATSPGLISLKALWLIGTMEREMFDLLGAFLNTAYVCEHVGTGAQTFVVRRYLGDPNNDYGNSPIPVGGDPQNLWTVYTRLAEENLAAPLSSQGLYDIGCCRLAYGGRYVYQVKTLEQQSELDAGYTLTQVGWQLQLLYERGTNELGERIFTDEARLGATGDSDGEAMRALLRQRVERAEAALKKGQSSLAIKDIECMVGAFVSVFGDEYMAEVGELVPRVEAVLRLEEERKQNRPKEKGK